MICHVTGYRERRSHYAFHLVNRAVDGFDTDRSAFLGRLRRLRRPGRRARAPLGQLPVSGWWPIASLSLSGHAAAGRIRQSSYSRPASPRTRRTTSGRATARRTSRPRAGSRARLQDARARRARLRRASAAAGTRCWTRCRSRTPDAQLNELVNTWNPYQCMVTFQLARSASLFETGRGRGIGFRDSNQDCLGVVHMVPDEVRDAAHAPRGHAEERRQRLSPVPAADAHRQRRDRRRLQRRPAVARARRRRLRARNRPRRPARRRPCRSRTRRMAAPRCAITSRRRSRYTLDAARVRTGCR